MKKLLFSNIVLITLFVTACSSNEEPEVNTESANEVVEENVKNNVEKEEVIELVEEDTTIEMISQPLDGVEQNNSDQVQEMLAPVHSDSVNRIEHGPKGQTELDSIKNAKLKQKRK